ncbi:MAG: alpha-ketoacid dehydrogenase subunit beta [Gammaproteobacteria bacterium]|nr:alpha-ketoacid dehydrogenase subunit beta [Gammaproteobacteria bacterium]
MEVINYGRSLNNALADAMTDDSRVVVMGEDIGAAGGPFGVTRGLLEKFGSDRVIDTPISEAAIVGAATGAAMSGLKPVVEIMFMDFSTLAMDAIVNQAAKAHFMFGGQRPVPMVVRTPHGGGLNAGPQHSQCLEAWFAHIPGLKVVCPSSAANAYGLLRAAIDDPNPVIFVEHKGLYAKKAEVENSRSSQIIGKAAVVRVGTDATIVSYGASVNTALEAADLLAEKGIEVEIVDLQSIQPWDRDAVLDSVKKTNRLVIAHEAVEAFGVGAEIAATVADIGFDYLDAPIVRVGAAFMPVPFAASLESGYSPNASDIERAVRRTLD